ncbi:MAG: VOC family protein [Deltaproteobacteria bacterium]|nr:VOC family protein [Deltaproteobacteria bacterium]
MQLNHLDLQVQDIQRTTRFFERFGFTVTSNAKSPAIAILRGEGGFVLVLQRAEGVQYPEDFHLGFLVPDRDTVTRMHTELTAAGEHVSPLEDDARGYRTYCRHDGLLVEVSCRRQT